ncbi:MAG: MlaD family protein [Solirubrobacteraceae bacterium]
METRAPRKLAVLMMLIFSLSCVGLLVFLWTSFGGTVPFAGRPYEFNVEFDQAVQLASQSDVRISGVSVGKVLGVALDRRTGLNRATIAIDRQYAPRPLDTRAVLRAKSLLGETYVELSPGSRGGPLLPDGGSLPQSQVVANVQLDQILSTFDPATRRAFQVWMRENGVALTGRGQNLNAALAQLYPFASNVDAVLSVLHRDSAATTTLLREGGQVFGALGAVPGQLQGLVRNSNAVFATTAAQDTALARAIRAFPGFLNGTRATVARLNTFAADANPLITELRPAAVQLSPALESIARSAPDLRTVLSAVGPLTAASARGVPALTRFLNETVPWLRRQTPYLGNLVPVFDYIGLYRRELAAFFANGTASTQGTLQNNSQTKLLHYLRAAEPVNPETLATYSGRLVSNRTNPYPLPGTGLQLANGLPVFGNYLCTSNPQPAIGASIPPALASVLSSVYYTSNPGGPPCRPQSLLGSATTGQPQAFPHLQPLR